MNNSALVILMLVLFSSPCAFASLVKEEVGVGPVDIRLPRWHQEIALESLSLSVDYALTASEPGPFSSIEVIKAEADLGSGGRVDITMSSSDACEEAWSTSNNESVVEGTRCLWWDESSYVVVDFQARFEGSSVAHGLEYLAMTSIEIKGNPSGAVFLCDPFGSGQP